MMDDGIFSDRFTTNSLLSLLVDYCGEHSANLAIRLIVLLALCAWARSS